MIVYHGLHDNRPRCPGVNVYAVSCRCGPTSSPPRTTEQWTYLLTYLLTGKTTRLQGGFLKFEDKSRIEFKKFGEISRAPFECHINGKINQILSD